MQVIIDRIEGNQAVVEFPDKTTVAVPLCLFPGGKEGDIYQILKHIVKMNESEKRITDKFNSLKKG